MSLCSVTALEVVNFFTKVTNYLIYGEYIKRVNVLILFLLMFPFDPPKNNRKHWAFRRINRKHREKMG